MDERGSAGVFSAATVPRKSKRQQQEFCCCLYFWVSARFLRQFRRLISSTGLCVSPLKKGESRGGGSLRTRGRTAFPSASFPSPYRPAGARPLFSRCGRLPAGGPLRFLSLMQRVAGAKAIPDARRADGAPMPHAARGGRGTAPSKRLLSRYRKKGSTGVQGESVSFEKGNTLTAAGADVRAQAQGKTALFPQCAGSVTSDQGQGFSPLTPCTAPGRRPAARAGQQPQWSEGHRLNTIRAFHLFQS